MDQLILALKALSDPNRLRVFVALTRHEELCACQITELLQVAGATVSRHLSLLVKAGLIRSRKQGRWVYYQLDDDLTQKHPLMQWLWPRLETSDRIVQDRALLEKIMAIEPIELGRKQRGETCCPIPHKKISDE